jgi:hypothetical protein
MKGSGVNTMLIVWITIALAAILSMAALIGIASIARRIRRRREAHDRQRWTHDRLSR